MLRRGTMTEYREIVRRLRAGMGLREIQRDTAMHRTIVRAIQGMAEVEGWLDVQQPLPSEEAVQKVRAGAQGKKKQRHPLLGYLEEFRQWMKAGHSFVV